MPRYRALIEYTDGRGREQTRTVEIRSRSDSADDLARAAQEAWAKIREHGDHLPHNIHWERLDEEEE
ncbi:MAG: hypothetical protein HY321_03585 [Armatimonadetes bacterium]|nr:hypothetical protein [Armatimonadota bacterium]